MEKYFKMLPFWFIMLQSCESFNSDSDLIKGKPDSNTIDSQYLHKYYPISKEEDNLISASFPGGDEELKKYIQKNIWSGKTSPANTLTGKVTVSFIVNIDGTLKDFKVIEEIEDCEVCNTESLRLAKKMPNWNPAYEIIDANGGKVNYEDKQAIEIEFSPK